MTTKAEVLQTWRFKEERVTMPSGVVLLVREFNGSARDTFEQSMVKVVDGKRQADLTNMRPKLVAACVIDDETNLPMFSVDELAAAPASFLDPLFEAAQRLNGLDAVDEEKEKNSEAAPSGSSTSA